jgi:DNA-binding response OmpR family regulator
VKVLIVEDELLVALNMEACLIAAGHSVLGIATTCAAAMKMAEVGHPELALVDMTLADHISGIVVAMQLRQQLAIESMFVTADPDRDLGSLTGALGCLSKPFSHADLMIAISAAESVLHAQKPRSIPANMDLYR